MNVTDLPTEEAWADAKNHTHEWRLTWGLAFSDWRTGGRPNLWARFIHKGKHSHGVAKGADNTNGLWLSQWRAYKKWLPKHLKRLAKETERMRKDLAVWGFVSV